MIIRTQDNRSSQLKLKLEEEERTFSQWVSYYLDELHEINKDKNIENNTNIRPCRSCGEIPVLQTFPYNTLGAIKLVIECYNGCGGISMLSSPEVVEYSKADLINKWNGDACLNTTLYPEDEQDMEF